MKTNELGGPALDWAVAKCEGMDAAMLNDFEDGTWLYWHRKYSTDWSQGGPIIERECIELHAYNAASSAPKNPEYWEATIFIEDEVIECYGPTPLIAAMRAFVASKLSDEVEVPEELT